MAPRRRSLQNPVRAVTQNVRRRCVSPKEYNTTLELYTLMYPIRANSLVRPSNVFYSIHAATGRTLTWLVWILAVLFLISSGITYRVLASRLKLVVDAPVALPVALSAFPAQVSNWVGSELSIPTTTKNYIERHFADDFLSRRYTNAATKAWADVYIVYCSSRPGGILGHRPRVCYPVHGWVHDSTHPSEVISNAGRRIPCLIHRFHKPGLHYEEKVVLNFYILNGQLTADEGDFSGVGWRTPNIAGDPARYIAQAQISSVLENSVRTAAKDMADLILDFLPDTRGKVRATENTNTAGGADK